MDKVYIEGSLCWWCVPPAPGGPQWKLGSSPTPAYCWEAFPSPKTPTPALSYLCFTPTHTPSVTVQVALREAGVGG